MGEINSRYTKILFTYSTKCLADQTSLSKTARVIYLDVIVRVAYTEKTVEYKADFVMKLVPVIIR